MIWSGRIKNQFIRLKPWQQFALLLLLFFPFRLAFGLCSEFWFEDEQQIYLLGLKFYCTGLWPYFGPDVVYTHTQIPGALQALLVGLPFYILPIPEAPYILLNILTALSLGFLAWYCTKRTPGIPRWFIWTWLMTCPWTMYFSTHVLNPSYALPGGIIFFIAGLEIIPSLSKKLILAPLAFFMLGFSFFWIFQLHMSWIVLLPIILVCFYFLLIGKENKITPAALFLAGCLLSGSLLLPTFLNNGLFKGMGGTGSNIVFDPGNVSRLFTVIIRFLSFSTYELTRFIGTGTKERIEFLKEHYWVIPFALYAGIAGAVQIPVLIIEFFRPKEHAEWNSLKYFTFITCLFIYFGFLFSVKGPASHTFYIFLPLSMIYSFYCFEKYFAKKWFRNIALSMLLSGILVQTAIGIDNFEKRSMYLHREIPAQAILKKDYHILGTRRSEVWGCCY